MTNASDRYSFPSHLKIKIVLMFSSDTDIEYEKLREKLDSFLENNCSDEDDYEEDEQPYLVTWSIRLAITKFSRLIFLLTFLRMLAMTMNY